MSHRNRSAVAHRSFLVAAAVAGLTGVGTAHGQLNRTLVPSTVDLGNVALPVTLPGYEPFPAYSGTTTVTTPDPAEGYTRLGIGDDVFDDPTDSADYDIFVPAVSAFGVGPIEATALLHPFDLDDSNHILFPLNVPCVGVAYAQPTRIATVHTVGPPLNPLLTDYVQVSGNGGSAYVDGSYQLGAVVTSRSLSGSQLFSFVQGNGPGLGVVPGSPEAFQVGSDGRDFAFVQFDTSRALAGMHRATLSLNFVPVVPDTNPGFQIQGLQTMPPVEINVFRRVPISGANASTGGSIALAGGDSYADVGATSTNGTTAQLLDGAAGGDRTLEMSFTPGGSSLASDVAHFTGTGADVFVLQMSYNPDFVDTANADNLRLLWGDLERNEFVNAVDGNAYSGGTPNFGPISGAYDPAYFELGRYGIDTTNHIVWAVLNHNSDYAVGFVGTAVPEPAGLTILGCAGLALCRRRRGR